MFSACWQNPTALLDFSAQDEIIGPGRPAPGRHTER
jgi:hypothetical protein